MILTKFKNLLKFQKATTFSSSCYFSETDDSFYKQSFFTKSYTKPFTITTEDNILSMNCVKGRFKQQQSYITLDKVGAMILDFIPVTKSTNEKEPKQQLDVRGKKNFTLGIKQVGELLKYNPHDLRNTAIKLEFKYYAGSQHEHKKLLIQKNAKEDIVSFNLTVTKQGNNVSFITPVDLGDFIIMQELCRYSLPFVLGWHIMNSPRIAEEEFNSTTPNSYENYN